MESAGKTQLVLSQLTTCKTCSLARTLSSLPGGGGAGRPPRSPAASAGGAWVLPAPQWLLRTHLGPLRGTGPAGNSFTHHQSRLPEVPASFAASACLKLPLLPQNRTFYLSGGGEAFGQVSRWRLG